MIPSMEQKTKNTKEYLFKTVNHPHRQMISESFRETLVMRVMWKWPRNLAKTRLKLTLMLMSMIINSKA